MRITKRQLRRIIREERARLLKEAKPSEMSMHDAADHYDRQRINTNVQVPAGLFSELVEYLEGMSNVGGTLGKEARGILLKMERELGTL